MSKVSLENMNVFKLDESNQTSDLQKKFSADINTKRNEYNANVAEKHRIKATYEDMMGSDEAFDFETADLASYKSEIDGDLRKIIESASLSKYEAELLDKYGNSFAYLYQVKKQSEKNGDDVSMQFKEVTQDHPVGIMTQEQYFEMSASQTGETKQIALQVDLPGENSFELMMPPYDKPGNDEKSVKAQIALADDDVEKLNKSKLTAILDFCNQYGLSTFDMDLPYSFDGSIDVDEKFKQMFEKIKETQAAKNNLRTMREFDENVRYRVSLQNEYGEREGALIDVSYDVPRESEIISQENEPELVQNAQTVSAGNAKKTSTVAAKAKVDAKKTQPNQSQSQAAAKPQANAGGNGGQAKPAKNIKDAEKCIENLLENGFKKVKDYHYFKEYSGIFHSGWTEYIAYDKGDVENRKKDARRDAKSKEIKYTYAFKIFVRQDKGKFRFAYRAPYGKKVDDAVINGIIGQMKSLGITHVRFPDGLPDNEKKIWRISLAENGIVPAGMGLDRVKAEAMLKAAKEKLTAEGYKKFSYKLLIQMREDNAKKGKKLPPSEQEFLDGLENSHKYLAFTLAYSDSIKGMLRDKLDAADLNHNDGAIDKCAAYVAARRLFDVYHENVNESSLQNSSLLTAEEKQRLQDSGISGPISEMTTEQLVEMYNVLLIRSKKDAKNEIDSAMMDAHDVGNRTSKGPKRADNVIIKEVFDASKNRFEKVNELLVSLGVDELSFPKAFGRLHYDNFYVEHPEFIRKPSAKSQMGIDEKSYENANNSDNGGRLEDKSSNVASDIGINAGYVAKQNDGR